MALTATTLNGDITAAATNIVLTSATGAAVNQFVRVDGEMMKIADVSLTPTILVARGQNGTAQIAHKTLAPIAYGNAADFANTVSPALGRQMVSYSVNGAIAVPIQDTDVILNKAGVAAMTLAAPGVDQNGLQLFITSNQAQANTVTATGLLNTGSASVNVATFAAQPGAGVLLEACAGKWNVVSATGITFS